jgi:hypothetical protein
MRNCGSWTVDLLYLELIWQPWVMWSSVRLQIGWFAWPLIWLAHSKFCIIHTILESMGPMGSKKSGIKVGPELVLNNLRVTASIVWMMWTIINLQEPQKITGPTLHIGNIPMSWIYVTFNTQFICKMLFMAKFDQAPNTATGGKWGTVCTVNIMKSQGQIGSHSPSFTPPLWLSPPWKIRSAAPRVRVPWAAVVLPSRPWGNCESAGSLGWFWWKSKWKWQTYG